MKMLFITMILMTSFHSFAAKPCSEKEALQSAKTFIKKEFKTTGKFPFDGSMKAYVSKKARLEDSHFTVDFSLATQFSNGLDVQLVTIAVDANTCETSYLKGDHTEELSL